MKKMILTILGVILLSFGAGLMTSKQIASAADEACDIGHDTDDDDCAVNVAYMGGKWRDGMVHVSTEGLDNATIKAQLIDAISHMDFNQNKVTFYHWKTNYPSRLGNVRSEDNNYWGETFIARADGSWFGGWPVDTFYENQVHIILKFNTDKFLAGTDYQEKGTARHELGHAIGLGHRNETNRLMWCFRSTRTVNYLTSSDKEVLEVIY